MGKKVILNKNQQAWQFLLLRWSKENNGSDFQNKTSLAAQRIHAVPWTDLMLSVSETLGSKHPPR